MAGFGAIGPVGIRIDSEHTIAAANSDGVVLGAGEVAKKMKEGAPVDNTWPLKILGKLRNRKGNIRASQDRQIIQGANGPPIAYVEGSKLSHFFIRRRFEASVWDHRGWHIATCTEVVLFKDF